MIELRRIIEQEIRERGPIPFSRYMELCLYHPELGYYSRNAAQFGKAGDFYTSSDVHAVFGRLMARQFAEMWRAMGSPEHFLIDEMGAGRGLFARDVLDWSKKKFPEFSRVMHYRFVEQSPALKGRIQENLEPYLKAGKASFLSAEDKLFYTNLYFANEFYDAIPFEIVSPQGSLRIDSRDGRFIESWAPASEQELQFLDRFSIHPQPGERVEVQLQSLFYLMVAGVMQEGFMVIIDYGYTREEQLAGRHRGTVKAIRQHSVSANPYEAPGEQDITADVNFTALTAALEECGFKTWELLTQSQFLMGIGEASQFADAFEDCRLPQERAKVALQLKHLVTPAGMGESFHVLVASKGVDAEKVARLAGLNFAKAPRLSS